ncbi:LUD domain-containing protein [Marinifilum fragile]|uniref:LUD domain-containing protein n=1 Tax=Marinifilum fragile TaxID=570161 RepID=UPI002AA7E7BC|nr:LUD domain-containing protein [Marinifilum fragile]
MYANLKYCTQSVIIVAALAFGPKNIVVFVGKNKIVRNIKEAIERIKNISAPLNALRNAEVRLPCQKTGVCMDCQAPHRICNVWTITEKSFPAKRIKIILIDEDLGY